jgi:hypothetical protein
LKLTDTQRDAVREATGKAVETVTLDVDALEERAAGVDERVGPEVDAIVWECLNPYP